MRISKLTILAGLLLPLGLAAQEFPDLMAQAPPGMPMGHGVRVMHGELGQWWKNSEVAQKLQLTNQQLTKLDQIFYQYRMNLIDYQAETEKQDLKLQALVDADSPDEAQINQQMDQVLESRGKLEREFTTMTLDLRRVLSLPQWKQLQSFRAQHGPDRVFFYKKFKGPPPTTAPAMPPAPPPPDGSEL